jgi:hypothetical protein
MIEGDLSLTNIRTDEFTEREGYLSISILMVEKLNLEEL